jgi:hypothetical protein
MVNSRAAAQPGLQAFRMKRSRHPAWNKRRGIPLDAKTIIASWEGAKRKLADHIDLKYYQSPMGLHHEGKRHLSWYAFMGKPLDQMSDSEAAAHLHKLRAHEWLPSFQ